MADERTSRNAETAKKILEAALELWNEKGYADATMRELGRRLGMGASSLYFYFRSKEEIVQYLYAEVNEAARARFFAEAAGQADFGRELARYLRVKLDLLKTRRTPLAAILREAIDPGSSLSPVSRESARVLAGSVGFFRELVERTGAAEASGLGADALARLAWLAHLAVLVFWLHDRAGGSAKTLQLVDKLSAASALLPFVSALPGAGELVELLAGSAESPLPPAPASITSSEEAAPSRSVDVVVLGGGPIGALTASFLRKRRPGTSVLVLERAAEPGHKIGESTLSGFCKALRTVGIPDAAMEALFFPKNGLDFLHVDESARPLTEAPEYVLETFDRTYQVERRPLDTLVLANARRLGASVLQGATVDVKQSRFGADGNVVVYRVGAKTFRVRASLVVDASGPAGVLARSLGLRTDEDVLFQTSSAWTYYDGITPLGARTGWRGRAQFPRDEYTVHLCFKEGWLWYIPLHSWQGAPTQNLARAVDALLSGAKSTRDELEALHGCPSRRLTSVGLTLRTDRDRRLHDDPRAALAHYARRYPAIASLLEGARQDEEPYGEGTTVMSRLDYRGHARHVVGDGWLLVGDAAFFVDPLVSPGLTGGTAGAFHAAEACARALDAGDFRRAALVPYERAILELREALEKDNELVYLSFNHPEALALVQRFQEIAARRHFQSGRDAPYSLEDTNVWGLLDPAYLELQRAAWELGRDEEAKVGKGLSVEEQSPRDYARFVKRLQALLGPFVEAHVRLTPYVGQNAGRAP